LIGSPFTESPARKPPRPASTRITSSSNLSSGEYNELNKSRDDSVIKKTISGDTMDFSGRLPVSYGSNTVSFSPIPLEKALKMVFANEKNDNSLPSKPDKAVLSLQTISPPKTTINSTSPSASSSSVHVPSSVSTYSSTSSISNTSSKKTTEIDEFYELFLAKQQNPKVHWSKAEEAVLMVHNKFDVSMKSIIDSVVNGGCLLDDSIIEYVEKKSGSKLKLRNGGTLRKGKSGNSLLSSSSSSLTSNSASNNPSSVFVKEEIKPVTSPVSRPLSSSNIKDFPNLLSSSSASPPSSSYSLLRAKSDLNFLYRKYQSLFDYLVNDLKLSPVYAKEAIESFSCKNIRSALLALKSLACGKRPWLTDLQPREENEPEDCEIKESIRKSTEELGFSLDDVLDAIAYDRCISVPDIVDVMESKQLQEQLKSDGSSLDKADFHDYLSQFMDDIDFGVFSLASSSSSSLASSPVKKVQKTSNSDSNKIDIEKEVKKMDRATVIKYLKKLSAFKETISGFSTKQLREVLLQEVQRRMR
jgi:hypothetical protein